MPTTAEPDPYTAVWQLDGGPFYAETNMNRLIKEPFNAASALLFLLLVAVWVVRLRGRWRQYPFLTACLPLLAAGGVGGTLYHALRAARWMLLLDVVPISLLAMALSLFLWARLRAAWWQLPIIASLYGLVPAMEWVLPVHHAINATYLIIAALVLTPVLLYLLRMRGQHASWVLAGLVLFAVAGFFRNADAWRPPLLPMGTHWLWHIFGAACTACLAEFVYRVESNQPYTNATPPAAETTAPNAPAEKSAAALAQESAADDGPPR